MQKNLLIGCSGYYYSAWKEKFYRGAPASGWLAKYSNVFNSVELNGTFYKTPTLENLKKQALQTPGDFKFSVKANKYITHTLRLQNSRKETESFRDLLLRGFENKLENILFQMPPSFQYNEENLETIKKNIPDSSMNVIEFRHISWWNEIVSVFFKSHNYIFCNVDFPGLQAGFVNTGDKFYLRLHGVPELFKSPYSQERLKDISANIDSAYKTCCVYFNNTFYGHAYENSLEMKKILKDKFINEK